MSEKIGYIRVSTNEQNTERQLHGLKLDRVFEEKLSGKNRERPKLEECLTYCRAGDTLYIHSVDRLARNASDLINIVDELIDKGVVIVFAANNMTLKGDDDLATKILLHVFGIFAEWYRKDSKRAQREGIDRARENDKNLPIEQRKYKGGFNNRLDDEKIQAIKDLSNANKTPAQVAAALGVSVPTVYKYRD